MTATVSLTQKNRAIVESFYTALLAGDQATLDAAIADDVVVDEPDYLPYGKVYHGKAELGGLIGQIGQFLELATLKVHYTVADGDRVIACLGIVDVTTGKMVHLLEQSTLRDGQIAEIKLFYNDPQSMLGKPKIV